MLTAKLGDLSLTEMRLVAIIQELQLALGNAVMTVSSHLPSTAGQLGSIASQLQSLPHFPVPRVQGRIDHDYAVLNGYGDMATAYRRGQLAMNSLLSLEEVNVLIQARMPTIYDVEDPKAQLKLLWSTLGQYDGARATSWYTPAALKAIDFDYEPMLVDTAPIESGIALEPTAFLERESGLYLHGTGVHQRFMLFDRVEPNVMAFFNGPHHTPIIFLYVEIERCWVQTNYLKYIDWRTLTSGLYETVLQRCTWPDPLTIEDFAAQILEELAIYPLGDTSTDDWYRCMQEPMTSFGYNSIYADWKVLHRVVQHDGGEIMAEQYPVGTRQVIFRRQNGRLLISYLPDGTIDHCIMSDPGTGDKSHNQPNVPVRQWKDLPVVDRLTWPTYLLKNLQYAHTEYVERQERVR